VLLAAVFRNQQIIYFCLVIFSVIFDSLLGTGLVLIQPVAELGGGKGEPPPPHPKNK
jgi:hypothetical protein